MNIKKKIIDRIDKGNNILLLGHKGPDGDSLGSMLAMANFLQEQRGKDVFMPGPIDWPGRYNFLTKHLNGAGQPCKNKIDTILFLDSSSMDRVDWGRLKPDDFQNCFKIMIDHHPGSVPFGDINWIDGNAAAVGEMIFDLLEEIGAKIGPEIAESLYSAIITDTGRFTYSNTSSRSLEVCAKLVKECHINPSLITDEIYTNFSEDYLRNIGIALYNSRTYNDARIVLLTLDRASVKSFSTSFDETEGIVDLAMSVKGVELAALFKEVNRNLIRVSLRSRGRVDVGSLASKFGGGGHHNAAGCTIKMPLSLTREVILGEFMNSLDNLENSGDMRVV